LQVLIPAYRPDGRLLKLVHELQTKTDYAIIVVNDGSEPEYDKCFQNLPSNVTLLKHQKNFGKGRAIKTGFQYIIDNSKNMDAVVIVDADGQHLISDIIHICDTLKEYPSSVITGCRTFSKKVPFRSRFGNKLTQYVFALASGIKLKDTQTGLRAIPYSLIGRLLLLKGDRYEYEMNMLLKLAEDGIPIIEIPITTVYLENNASSHFNVLKDSFKIYAVILKFALSSFIAYLIDFVMLFVLRYATNGLGDSTSLMVSVVGARVVSSIINYFINRHLVFKNRENALSSFIKYYILVVVILLVNMGLMDLFNLILGVGLFWTKIITELILFSFSFIAQRMFVFKKKKIPA